MLKRQELQHNKVRSKNGKIIMKPLNKHKNLNIETGVLKANNKALPFS